MVASDLALEGTQLVGGDGADVVGAAVEAARQASRLRAGRGRSAAGVGLLSGAGVAGARVAGAGVASLAQCRHPRVCLLIVYHLPGGEPSGGLTCARAQLGKGAYGIVWRAMDKKTKDVVRSRPPKI